MSENQNVLDKKCKTEGCDNEVKYPIIQLCKKCYDKQYEADNKEKIKIKKKKYHADNKEKISERHKQHYSDNKEKILVKHRQYNSDNKEKINEQRRQRRQTDPMFRIMRNASRSVSAMLIQNGGSKQGKGSKQEFSFTEEELRFHLESLFDHPDSLDENGNVWMTMDNHGNYDPNKKTWHLDHRIPQSKLQFDSYEHPNFQKCWALENLRPLEAIKNLKKGNKII